MWQGPVVIFITGRDRQRGIYEEGSNRGPITQNRTIMSSWEIHKKLNQQERREVSWVEENVPTPVPLNEINTRVDTDHL